ncbi:hypothetical protein XAP6164_3870003 [Xanthomonas phaseoli pv. phaseoli]|nr:hypothetical protein XAP6164_3870003 [Xanthomonas phaseoli pv. phaseoli]
MAERSDAHPLHARRWRRIVGDPGESVAGTLNLTTALRSPACGDSVGGHAPLLLVCSPDILDVRLPAVCVRRIVGRAGRCPVSKACWMKCGPGRRRVSGRLLA